MKALLNDVLHIAVRAGLEILDVYKNEFNITYKGDGSPLTVADRRAHELILAELKNRSPEIPVLSEESDKSVFEQRRQWTRFWLVDPLDGTKEFVKRNGEFTVNIALVDKGVPILGVVHTPVKNVSHYAAVGVGAFRSSPSSTGDDLNYESIRVRKLASANATMVASRSHCGAEVEQYRKNLADRVGKVEITSMGSSLKICLVAEGSADIYPRLGPTSEWDTAAAHCVLEAAGGQMIDIKGNRLRYNKSNILNPWFLACGDKNIDWTEYVEGS